MLIFQFHFWLFWAGFLDSGASWTLFRVFLTPTSQSRLVLVSPSALGSLLSPLVCVTASERGKKRRAPRSPRLLHPLRGQRIGEAAQPGPSATSSSMTATCVTTGDSTLPDPDAGTPPPEFRRPMALQEVQINIRMATGRPATLKCLWLPKFDSWKWYTTRCQHQGRGQPGQILREWAERYKGDVAPEGHREIESVLALHPDPPVGPPDSDPPAPALPPPDETRPPAPPTAMDLPDPCGLTRCTGCYFWTAQAIATQRQIPKTCHALLDQVCSHALRILHDPGLSQEHRRVLLSLILCMPRWLWPEPPHTGEALHPHARPQLLKARARLFLSNDWQPLLESLSDDIDLVDQPDAKPRTPGVMEDKDHQRLLHAAKQGRLTAAWRHLHSYGVAASNATTQNKLERKWIPAPAFSAERRGHYLAPSDAQHILNHADILKASQTLAAGAAVDALGWSHEAWQTTYRTPRGQQLFRELLILYATGETGREATDLINCSLAIPLYKDVTGESLRPIAIPSVFRKVYARIFVTRFRPQLRDAAGPHQFAAMTRDGARGIACTLRQHQTSDAPAQLYMRTDIANAFNQADRQATLSSLAKAHPLLEAGQYSWLRHPTQAVLTAPRGGRRVMTTDVGIPQGDPLSSLAFSLLVAGPPG